jgi:chromosome segregation ATPase
MRDVRKIKQLRSELENLEIDASVLKTKLAIINTEFNYKRAAIEKLKEEIKRLSTTKDPKVSEHAIVRYFERVKGFDISEIEKEILTEEVLELIEKLGGSGSYPNKDFSVVMKDFTVTTIV